MEILFVSHKFPPSIGGMQKQSVELITGMEQFTRVHSIVYTGEESRVSFFLFLNKRILELCRQFPKISGIHFNDALLAALSLRHTGYSHLFRAVTVHGLDVVFPSRVYQKFILPAFNRFDLIIAVSQATASACIERGISPEKVVVINNGVDPMLLKSEAQQDRLNFFQATYKIDLQGKTVLTMLGRPVKRKGFSWFIEKVVPKLQGDFVLIMAGPFNPKRPLADRLFQVVPATIRTKIALLFGYSTDENPIRKLLDQPRFTNKIIHLGKLPADEIGLLLSVSDAFLMPNIAVEGDMEGFGLVCLEASLCGAWVFAAQIDGITDAIKQGKNGTLLQPKNEAIWSAVLNDFMANPLKYKDRVHDSVTYTRTYFGWQKMVETYWAYLSKAKP